MTCMQYSMCPSVSTHLQEAVQAITVQPLSCIPVGASLGAADSKLQLSYHTR